MINVSNQTKEAYKTEEGLKQIEISVPAANLVLTNEDLVAESIKLTEILESEECLTFKGCNASKLEFKCADLPNDIRGMQISVVMKITGCDNVPLFYGYVDEQNNETHEDITTTIIAYDPIYKVSNKDVTSWYEALTFPMTIKAFRDSFFANIGITQETTTLVNDSLNIEKSIFNETICASTIMRGICQLNARYGRMSREGVFQYVKLETLGEGLYPSETVYPSDELFPQTDGTTERTTGAVYSSCTYEPYTTDKITKVSIFDSSGVNVDYGAGSNVFCIADNPIAYGVNRVTASHNIYDEVRHLSFIPAAIGIVGLPYLETGDSLLFNTRKNIVRTYILSRTLSGIQQLSDSYEAKSTKSRPLYKESVATTISRNEKSILRIDADIVQMNTVIAQKATITDLNATNARVGSLEADHVTTAQLNAVSARVGTIEADYVTAGTLNAKNFTANHVTAGTINGNYVQWQKINCIGSGSFGYLYKNNSTKDIVFTSTDQAPNPSYTRLCGFLDGLHVKSFYTLAKDNA